MCSLKASGFHIVLYTEYWTVIVFNYDVTNNTYSRSTLAMDAVFKGCYARLRQVIKLCYVKLSLHIVTFVVLLFALAPFFITHSAARPLTVQSIFVTFLLSSLKRR